MKKRINPIAAEVQETFDAIYEQTKSFIINPGSAVNGMIVSGDAGTGKSYTVSKAIRDQGHEHNVEVIKGGKITAASFYVKLWISRAKGKILILDDCDLVHHKEKAVIVPLLLGACELGQKGDVAWEVAQKNPMMTELNVPTQFNFQGNIIWITNDSRDSISKALPQWKHALNSRFNFASCYFTDDQKFMYTLHLIENHGMLSHNCLAFIDKDGTVGYPTPIIEETLDYMTEHYRQLIEITPRQAIKIADTLHHNSDPILRDRMLRQLWK
jgi:hypothetical protein